MLVKVPCGPCTACCKNQTIYLMTEEGDDPSRYLTRKEFYPIMQKEGLALQQKPNGDCIYLSDEGCSIHAHAPMICQTFDCRRFVKNLGGRAGRRRALRDKQLDQVILDAAMERMHTLDDKEKLR